MGKTSRKPMEPRADPSTGLVMSAMPTSSADLAALTEAIAIVWRHPARGPELAEVMAQRGWNEAAEVAAYDVQCRSLNLPPWESPPCVASVRGSDRAARLLRRMLRRGISKFHPRPLQAIELAGAKKG
jgi:hypothetical protein